MSQRDYDVVPRAALEILARGARAYSGESVRMAKQLLEIDAANSAAVVGWVMITYSFGAPGMTGGKIVKDYVDGPDMPTDGRAWLPVRAS